METLGRKRGHQRAAVTRLLSKIDEELKKDQPDLDALNRNNRCLIQLKEKLLEMDENYLDKMVDTDETEEAIAKEMDEAAEYVDKIMIAQDLIEKKIIPIPIQQDILRGAEASISGEKTYKLPKVEIKKFSGEVTEWLSWWNQFQRIHEDDRLHDVDKFQYLTQSMVERSKAADLIRVYPQTEGNYKKAVKALEDRFGKPKILKRVYVRELLKMIINNSRGRVKIGATFDMLEAHLKALESLGITPDQMDVILFPMVESCLPEEILVAWQRSPNFGREDKAAMPPKTEFDFLMEFVKQEVENEGQRELAQSGFDLHVKPKESWKDKIKQRRIDMPTASSLHSSSEKKECIFCQRSNHPSFKCHQAKRMSFEDRKAAAQKFGYCFRCLRIGHNAANCNAKIECFHCKKKHLGIMCPGKEKRAAEEAPNSTQTENECATVASNSNQVRGLGQVLLKTLHVGVKGRNGKEIEARVLFDDGSQHSYVKTSVAKQLKCHEVGSIQLRNNLFGGHQTIDKTHKFYEATLRGLKNDCREEVVLLDEEVITSACPTIPRGPWIEELAQEKIFLSDTWSKSPEVEVLIGSDLWGKFMTGKMKKLQCGLTAHETVFGWTLSGKIPREITTACSVISMHVHSEKSIQDMWSLESLGIRDTAEQISSEEHDYEVKKKLQENLTRDSDGRYIVKLPWVNQTSALPSNKAIAEKRLQRATEKLKSQEKFEVYDAIFKSWEEEGLIEVHVDSSLPQHYLPHHPVFKPESLTTPVRPVFDASCKVGRNLSLNNCLEKGPNMMELIPSILLRFRENKYGVIADIRKAFQMIGVAEEDRNFQKFLWWEDSAKKVLKEYRHCRVVFGMTCSPFILAAVIDHHLSFVRPEDKVIAETLKKSTYVDNVVLSVNEEKEYQEFRDKSVMIFLQAKMDLRQWETNLEIQRGLDSTHVLGLKWLKEKDVLVCQVPKIEDLPDKVNKRVVLSIVSQIFDPIGFTCPAVIQPKILLQEAWATSMDWDKDWEIEKATKFRKWLKEIPELAKIEIPRFMGIGNTQRGLIQLHMFCDASKNAYAAVIFVRVQEETGASVQLVEAKARLAPLDKKKKKRVTIPRLELMGCLVGARLLHHVIKSLNMEDIRTFCWSDSTTALAWIRRDEDWGIFVGNRSREINQLTKSNQWRHVPGILNPADLPSRGCSPAELLASRWWEGPTWLKMSEEYWPCQEESENTEEIMAEKKKSTLVMTNKVFTPRGLRFSNFLKNVRVAAWIRRFLNNARDKEKNNNPYLSLEEMKNAEIDLIRNAQEYHWDTLNGIKTLKTVVGADGLIHVDSKITTRDDNVLFCRPILLPREDILVRQLIEYVHRTNCHAGVQFVLGKIREKYWIPQGRKTVSKVIKQCVTCKRHSGKGIVCETAPLPKDRVQATFAFQTTGVDLAGPLLLKGSKKAWIVIYTCAVYRGVVLDIVDSISTADFLESLQKFTWTVGRPSTIYSDNGTNFVGACNLLKKVNMEKLSVNGINWIFNPPTAAWWGGWWERLVRTLKELLRKMIGTAKLSRKDLEKCLWHISHTINNRPLTTLTEDVNDLTPLTPVMFMRNLPVAGMPEIDQITPRDLQEAYNKMNNLRKLLQSRFRKEYLGLLVQKRSETWKQELQVGDVVLVGADNKKRYEWPLGRILELYPGKDRKVRVARVKTSTGEFLRPLQRLYPLELSRTEGIRVPESAKEENNQVYEECEAPAALEEEGDVKKTRSGRLVKEPIRYTGWNY